MDKRTILAVVLSVAVLLTYQMFFCQTTCTPQRQCPHLFRNQNKQIMMRRLNKHRPHSLWRRQSPQLNRLLLKKKSRQEISRWKRKITVAVFSTRGAALKSFQLKKYQKECTKCAKDILS